MPDVLKKQLAVFGPVTHIHSRIPPADSDRCPTECYPRPSSVRRNAEMLPARLPRSGSLSSVRVELGIIQARGPGCLSAPKLKLPPRSIYQRHSLRQLMNEPHHFFHSDGIFSSYLKEEILQPVGLPRSRRPLLRMMWLLGPYQAPGTYLLGLCVDTVPHNYQERAISTMQVSDPVQDLPLPSLTIGLHSVRVACILRFPSPFCVLMRVGHSVLANLGLLCPAGIVFFSSVAMTRAWDTSKALMTR